ncbi:MAG: flagellar hook-associated protein FlgK [Deltaproteobacteria bacterium]|nr:flagellar hook-associated protein FlgK [Deltaproteobacteria bacterium]
MSGLTSALNIGCGALFLSQKGIEVTGNNISNASTEGYSLQTLTVTSLPTLEIGGNFVGTGAVATGIERETDSFVTAQIIEKNADCGEYNAKMSPLSQIETAFSSSDDSLASEIDAFFESWQELSTNPAGTSERQQVIQMAENIADSFQSINDELTTIQEGINTTLTADIPALNQTLQEIADLNVQITATEATGVTANGLRDQRDLLLQEVSETIGITCFESNNGMVSVQLPNGQPLVSADAASTISTERVDGVVVLSLNTGNSTVALDVDDVGGEIKGLLSVRDEYIPEVRDKLDQLAYEFATAVNDVHASGVDLNGDTGGDLFTFTTSTASSAEAWTGTAASLAAAFSDTSLIAAGTTGETGDNANTLAMVELQESAVIDGTTTFAEFYSAVVTEIGVTVRENESKLSAAEDSLAHLNSSRESISGVSLEEETLKLLEYQTLFEAASKYISVVEEMMDTLMSI